MFGKEDILWVRNVKRDEGRKRAYYEEGSEHEFILHWSRHYKNADQALKPQVGDLILLYQRLDGVTQLTHLVTPVDNSFVNCHKNNPNHPWGRRVKTIARAHEAHNPKPVQFNFTSVNQGHSYRVETIKTEFDKQGIQNIIWNSFEPFIKQSFEQLEEDIFDKSLQNIEVSAMEGTPYTILKEHIVRERNRKLVKEKKFAHRDRLICECCSFDFSKYYGTIGKGFIECHHKMRISRGERLTKIEDLALVCSNCHRMLHRKDENGKYLSVKELRDLIEKTNP